MLKTGFQLFFKGFGWVNFLITLGIIAFFTAIFFLLNHMLQLATTAEWTIISTTISILFTLLGLYSLFTYKYKSYGKIVFPSQVQSLIRNIRQSLQTKRNLAQYDFEALVRHNPYAAYTLQKKPNIYFLAVESYGRIVYDEPQLFEHHQAYMTQFEKRLKAKNWHACSHLSTAPISGGSSWISFTSLLFGLCIKDQGSYLTMLHHPVMQRYPNMMRVLKSKGYQSYRLVAIAGFKCMKISCEAYQQFYAIDEWINFEDLNYEGKMYGFGPCPPDQYSLSFAHEYIRSKQKEPYFLFYITQNSHSPFGSPESVVENWKELNQAYGQPQFSSSIFVRPKLEDYKKAIRYQLDNLTDFIAKNGSENDLFIIVGDHQPPVFPKPDAGWETPIHIIGKNKDWTDQFQDYGFCPGLLADKAQKPMRHEGVYSMFMRELLRICGEENTDLPPFRPEGIKFN